MQSICTLLPDDFAQLVVNARADLAEKPSIGAIYDPPFVHFTQQLAEEYDWDGLARALAEFTANEQPFEAQTMGLWVGGNGENVDVAVVPYASEQMRDFHDRLWQVVTPYAKGNVNQFYAPGTWFPHVTIKRCGTDHGAFARAIQRLVDRDYRWTFTVDNVSVQHDPGKNSRTHYLRLRYPLGGGEAGARVSSNTNGTLADLAEENAANGDSSWVATVELDGGGQMHHRWTAPDMVRLMASLMCSDVHLKGGRCLVEDGQIVAVEPKTPFPLVR